MDYSAADLNPQQRAAGLTIINALDPATNRAERVMLLAEIAIKTRPGAPGSGSYIGALLGYALAINSKNPAAAHALCEELRTALEAADTTDPLNGRG